MAADPLCPCEGRYFACNRVRTIDQLYTLSPSDPHYPRYPSKRGDRARLERVREYAHNNVPGTFDAFMFQKIHQQIDFTIDEAKRNV
ncbi:MAG: hypothetical protein ACRD04_06005 [Terriglobales bacterium]